MRQSSRDSTPGLLLPEVTGRSSAGFLEFKRQTGPRLLLLTLLVTVLCSAIGLTIFGETRPLEQRFHGSVKELLPNEKGMQGWSVQILPIADTPEMQTKVDELLNYDEAVYASYTKGAQHISIYIAYWRPGKMSPRLVAGHTPDICWVRSGWKRQTEIAEDVSAVEHDIQYRVFAREGQTAYVVFGHRIGDDDISYSRDNMSRWYSSLIDIARWGLDQRKEQIFIRIAGNFPPSSWPAPMLGITGIVNSRTPLSTAGAVTR